MYVLKSIFEYMYLMHVDTSLPRIHTGICDQTLSKTIKSLGLSPPPTAGLGNCFELNSQMG